MLSPSENLELIFRHEQMSFGGSNCLEDARILDSLGNQFDELLSSLCPLVRRLRRGRGGLPAHGACDHKLQPQTTAPANRKTPNHNAELLANVDDHPGIVRHGYGGASWTWRGHNEFDRLPPHQTRYEVEVEVFD
jgi:hypothetical protein